MFDIRGGVEEGPADPLAVVAGLRRRHADIAREQFAEIDAVMDLYVVRCGEDARAGVNDAHQGEFAHVEVASVLAIGERAARRMIGLGCELRWRLHRVREAFAAGRIDLGKAHALAEALANVSDDVLPEIEKRLLDGAEDVPVSRLRTRARRLIARLDPEGVLRRRKAALADCDVRISARDDGTAAVDGHVSAAGGRVLAQRLRAMSYRVCSGDPRSYGQRRSDALVALAAGQSWLRCRCGAPDCSAPRPEAPAVQVQILVGVSATTLLGFDDRPGFLAGHGPIDADLARALAADATWKRILTATGSDRDRMARTLTCDGGPIVAVGHPLPAPTLSPLAVAERTYRPGAQLADIVRTRDGVCRFPNCEVPADSCDLDHTIPFDHDDPGRGGPTSEANLACLCRRHHRLKTLGHWQVRQLGSGRLEWTDPTGRSVVTEPEGMFDASTSESESDGASGSGSDSAAADLELGLDPALRAMLSPPRARARLRHSVVESELDYLCDATVSPRLAAHRRSRAATGGGAVETAAPPPDADAPPPF